MYSRIKTMVLISVSIFANFSFAIAPNLAEIETSGDVDPHLTAEKLFKNKSNQEHSPISNEVTRLTAECMERGGELGLEQEFNFLRYKQDGRRQQTNKSLMGVPCIGKGFFEIVGYFLVIEKVDTIKNKTNLSIVSRVFPKLP